MPKRTALFSVAILVLFSSCTTDRLPILSKSLPSAPGQYQVISAFSFINQDSQLITNQTFEGKAYVADFFFTSCPTICPVMTREMMRIHERFKADDRFLLLSHSIDTKRDTVQRLKEYAEGLGVDGSAWHFVTGDRTELFAIADDYYNVVTEDASAPGGYDHSGRFTLVDQNGHIRAYCNGTSSEEVAIFMNQIEKLLVDEY
ncbi:MAG: SCO family protein [Bacteroidota bacterium]